jgi:hypothetical protein
MKRTTHKAFRHYWLGKVRSDETKAKISAACKGKDSRSRDCARCGEWIKSRVNRCELASKAGLCKECYDHWKHGLRRARVRFTTQAKRASRRPQGSWELKMQRLALSAKQQAKERSRPRKEQPRRIGATWAEAFEIGVERLNQRARYHTEDPMKRKLASLARCNRSRQRNATVDVVTAA